MTIEGDSHERIAAAWKGLLEALGYSTSDPHFQDSPDRVGRFLSSWHTKKLEPPKLTTFPNTDKYDQIVIVSDLSFYAMCAHHGAPFFGKAAIAYIPSQQIVGLSKFARVLDHFAHRFTTQEQITQDVETFLTNRLDAKAVGVILTGEHLCMSLRGVQKPGHTTTTSALSGYFRNDNAARAELMALLRR